MSGEETESGGTVADSPAAKAPKRAAGPTPATVITGGRAASPAAVVATLAEAVSSHGSSMSLTTAAEAMRDEEVRRTRLFIRMGWVVSLAVIGIVPFFSAPLEMDVALIAAMLFGIAVSSYFHQRFAQPGGYTDRTMMQLAFIAVVNSNVAVLYFGTFTVTPVILVLGIHFVARTENERAAQLIWAEAAAAHAIIAIAIIAGVIDDPGVFASDRPQRRVDLAAGALFVQGMYALAYYTARAFRGASLSSIEQLQAATRLASQREALMQELRADLEKALRVGGPGRYSEQIVGAYRLGVVIGRGAMGEVYEGAHVDTGDVAAVKLLRRELLADATHVARFLREARASGALASPHVVRVLETAADGAALPYLAMERLHGQTLAEVLRGEPRRPVSEVRDLVAQVGAGIDAAARAGIVHRDLKPQNLFRCEGPRALWKILDFGVATLSEDAGTLTQGGIVGTPSYMAPEQARGDRVDERADLYALAAVAYRCLTGRHPFAGADTPAILYAVVHRAPPRPGAIADLPADVDRWIALALAKDRGDRFPTGADLAAALTRAIANDLDPRMRKKADGLIKARPWEAA